MSKANLKPEPWQSKLGTRQFDPLEVLEFQDVLKAKKSEVILSGRKFILDYYFNWGKEMVYYCLASGESAPCGHLDIERFMQEA